MNYDRPAVSVVVCTYNAQEWIEEAIASVIAQTCGSEALEIVIVDSGSEDSTLARASTAATRSDIPFQVFPLANVGPSRARNVGWRGSRGDWIQFLDGDDFLDPQKINVQLATAQSQRHEVAVVYSGWSRVKERNSAWHRYGGLQSPAIGADPISDLLRPGNFIHIGSQLIRRAWLERISGFDERHWLIEDVDLLLRLAMLGARFCHVPSQVPLFYYRQLDRSLSHRNHRDFIEGCLRNTRMVEAHSRQKGDLNLDRRGLLAEAYLQGARYYASRDPHQFDAIVRRIEVLVPGFVPRFPRRLRYASRVLGYRRAERLATLYRSMKAG